MADAQEEHEPRSPLDEVMESLQRGAEELERRMKTPEYIEWHERAREGWRKLIAEYEAEHGAFTEEEIAAHEERLSGGTPGAIQIIDVGPIGVLDEDDERYGRHMTTVDRPDLNKDDSEDTV